MNTHMPSSAYPAPLQSLRALQNSRPDVLVAGHPYLPSERVAPEVLAQIYATDIGNMPPALRYASYCTEASLAGGDPALLDEADVAARAVVADYPRGGTEAGRAELFLAFLPFSRVRRQGQAPGIVALEQVYTQLARLLYEQRVTGGERTEVALGALCVRLAIMTGNNSYTPHLSPPRMEASDLHTPGGEVFNSDLHLSSPFTPIQAKAGANRGRTKSRGANRGRRPAYEPGVLKIRIPGLISSATEGTAWGERVRALPKANERARVRTQRLVNEISREGRRGGPYAPLPFLNDIGTELQRVIDTHRIAHPLPEDPTSLL